MASKACCSSGRAVSRVVKKSFDIRFEACEAGMKRRNISKEALYPFVQTVHSALVSLTHWQSLGYAHVPIP